MNQDPRLRLEEVLDREIGIAALLAEALAEEQAALTGDAPDAVQQRSTEKVRHLQALEQAESERRALDGAAGGMAGSAAIAQRWQALLNLIARCKAANEVNGYIIHVRQNQIRQLVDIVRGGAPVTYGPQGRTSAKTLRALARA
jgi:flagella synthesis protein FlgN